MEEKNKKVINYRELIVPAIMLAAILIYLVQIIGIRNPLQNLLFAGPVIIILFIILAVIVFGVLRKEEGTREGEGEERISVKKLKMQLFIILGIVLYLFLMDRMGFILSSALFVFLGFLILGLRRWYLLLVLSIILPVVIFVVFRGIFYVLLPESFIEVFILNNFLY